MTWLRALLVAALVLLLPTVSSAEDPPWAVRLWLRMQLANGKLADYHGSGTVIARSNGYSAILTCQHVCPFEGQEVAAYDAEAKEYRGRTYKIDQRADLAVVVVKGDLWACHVARQEAPPGELLRQWGFPGRARGALIPKIGQALGFSGVVTSTRSPIYWSTISAESGDSGAGVFDAAGKLVGVCWGGNNGRQSATGVRDVWRFLKACQMVDKQGEPVLALTPSETSSTKPVARP